MLFGLVKEHLEDFLRHAREAYDRRLPKYVVEEFRGYLRVWGWGRAEGARTARYFMRSAATK